MNFKLFAVLVAFVLMAFASTTFADSQEDSSENERAGNFFFILTNIFYWI